MDYDGYLTIGYKERNFCFDIANLRNASSLGQILSGNNRPCHRASTRIFPGTRLCMISICQVFNNFLNHSYGRYTRLNGHSLDIISEIPHTFLRIPVQQRDATPRVSRLVSCGLPPGCQSEGLIAVGVAVSLAVSVPPLVHRP
jgi:hypothetical protein